MQRNFSLFCNTLILLSESETCREALASARLQHSLNSVIKLFLDCLLDTTFCDWILSLILISQTTDYNAFDKGFLPLFGYRPFKTISMHY